MLTNYYDDNINSNRQQIQFRLSKALNDRKDLDKQINSVQNRLNLLQQEDEQQNRKIKNRKYKIKKILDVYNFKQELEEKKNHVQNKRQLKHQQLQENVSSTRLNQTRVLDEIREMMLQQKQIEKSKIQLQTQIYEKDIRKNKFQNQHDKKIKAQKIKEHINRNQLNIINYWDNRLQSFSQEKIEKIQACEYEKQIKANLLQKLLESENNNLQKLQNSQENLSRLDNLLNQSMSTKKSKLEGKGKFHSQRFLDQLE